MYRGRGGPSESPGSDEDTSSGGEMNDSVSQDESLEGNPATLASRGETNG